MLAGIVVVVSVSRDSYRDTHSAEIEKDCPSLAIHSTTACQLEWLCNNSGNCTWWWGGGPEEDRRKCWCCCFCGLWVAGWLFSLWSTYVLSVGGWGARIVCTCTYLVSICDWVYSTWLVGWMWCGDTWLVGYVGGWMDGVWRVVVASLEQRQRHWWWWQGVSVGTEGRAWNGLRILWLGLRERVVVAIYYDNDQDGGVCAVNPGRLEKR